MLMTTNDEYGEDKPNNKPSQVQHRRGRHTTNSYTLRSATTSTCRCNFYFLFLAREREKEGERERERDRKNNCGTPQTCRSETSTTTTNIDNNNDKLQEPVLMGRFRQSLPGKTQLDSNILYYSIRSV